MGVRAVNLRELSTESREVLNDLPRFKLDHQYFRANRDALLRDHDGEWVAVYKQAVISAHRDRERVIRDLEERGLRPSAAAIRLVTSKQRLYFF
jgi:hypothetical protein